MKRRMTALILTVALLVSCMSFIGFAEDNLVYLQDYSQFQIDEGASYKEYFYSSNGSSWNLNAAGSWAIEWLVNDSFAKNGNYMAVYPANQDIKILTSNASGGQSGRLKLDKNFILEFSFNSLKSRPSVPEENNRNPGAFQICIFPDADVSGEGRNAEGVILNAAIEDKITVVDNGTERDAAEFTTERNTWYDMKIVTDFSTPVPTFNVYIKQSADSDYTLIAENVSFPKSGNYQSGLGMYSVINIKGGTSAVLAVDDIKVEYYEKRTAPEAKAVFVSGSGSVGQNLYGMYEFVGSPGEGISRYEWLVSDTQEGTYTPISGADGKTLFLGQELKDKYVKFRVTPVNQDDEQGIAVTSPCVKIIESGRDYGVDHLNNDAGELKIAFLGGSITYGTGASAVANRYSTQIVSNYFKSKFPNKTVTEINSGIGGTPSDLGLMRLNKEISSQNPDVVFVEYAVNDGHFDKVTAQRQYEGIVRQLLQLEKQPVVIPLYTCKEGLDETTAMYQQEVAEYYGLGSVNFISYVKNLEAQGQNSWGQLSSDGTHPNDAGHQLYAQIAIAAFESSFNSYFKTYSVPSSVMSDHEFIKTMLVPYNEVERVAYDGNFVVDPSDMQKDAYSGYAHWANGSVTSDTVGDKVTFRFKGTSIGLWAMRGAEYGKVSYSIDNGKYTGEINNNSSYNMSYATFFKCDLDGGEHTMVLENIGGGTKDKFTFGYFFTDNDYDLRPNCENVKISGPMEFGGTLNVTYDFNGNEEDCTYRWLYSDSEFGEYQPIPNGDQKNWNITTTYANKYVRAEVTAGANGNVSLSPAVQIPGTAEIVVYSQTYEQRELGKTVPTSTWSSWCHNVAGSYANVFLLNDSYSVSGNYLVLNSLNASSMKALTTVPTKGTDGTLYFTRDFLAEFSFNNFSAREDLGGGTGAAEVTVCMWPAALGTNGRDQAALDTGKLLSIAPGVSISCYDDGQEIELDSQFVPARNEWYDVRIVTDLDVSSEETPTYSAYLKKSGDADYTLIAEHMSYPKAYGYSAGISTYAFLNCTQNAGYLGLDNIKLYYPPLSPQPPKAENLSVQYDKMATGQTITASYDFSDPNNDEELNSSFAWYRGDSADGTFEKIQGANQKTYTLTEADENKYLKFEVTPAAAVEPYEGETVLSQAVAGAFAPVAENIRLAEGAVVGRTVACRFDYSDLNGDLEDAAKYQWLIADEKEGTPQPIEGADAEELEVKAEYDGKYLFVKVTPVSTEKPYEGESVVSEGFLVSGSNQSPQAKNVTIEGSPVVGVAVSGVYEFSDPDGDSEGTSLYRWYISSDDQEYTLIENQNSQTLYLNETYKNQYIQFEVIPVDSAQMQGAAVRSDGVYVENKLANELFVSLDGDDANEGTLEKPLKTLEGARDAIRRMKREGALPAGGMTVYLRGGEYHLDQSFSLTQQDSGTEDCPIMYRNYKDEQVTISGKHDIDFSKFAPIADEVMKNKLRSADARAKVVAADLSAIGLEDFQPIVKNGQSGSTEPLVFFDGGVCTLARYPNTEDVEQWPLCYYSSKDAAYIGTQPGYSTRYGEGTPGTYFIVKYADETVNTWGHNSDQWLLNGYLKYYWAPEVIPVTIDVQRQFIKAKVETVYGVEDSTAGRPFQMMNVYEEIDQPGEWYIDTVNQKMYIYPTTDTPEDFYMSTLSGNLISVSEGSNITFRGLNLCGGQGNGVYMKDCDNVVIDSCELSGFQSKAYRMDGGVNCGIKNSHVHHLGAGGMYFADNGSVTEQIRSNNFVTNCEINDFQLISKSYTAAVYIANGVGNLINHNEIYHSDHCAIRFEGPLNVIEYNEFHDCVKTATDMAAVYTGRNLKTVGNEIRYNYFHNIGGNETGDHGTQAIFFDDGTSGNSVYCNVFGEKSGTLAPIKNYGGFDTHYYNNLFLNNPVIGYECSWQWDYWRNYAKGQEMNGDVMLGASKYYENWPWLEKLNNNSFGASDYTGNLFENNLFFGIDTLLANPYMTKRYGDQYNPYNQKNNLEFQGNTAEHKAYFEDYTNGNYNLTESAYTKIRSKIPEFMEIPFLWMGRQSVINSVPEARNVALNGMQTLSVTYDYYDAEKDLEGAAQFAWFAADSKDGTYREITGAAEQVYQVAADYYGKYIKAAVTPVDEYGISGKTVMSDPVFVVAGVESLQVLADNVEQVLKTAKAGGGLGEYPAQAIADLEEALQAAKAVLDGSDTTTGIVNAAKNLDQAYEDFKNQQVTSLVSDLQEGTITIPSDLRKLTLHLGEVTGKIVLDGAQTLPETTVTAVVGGVTVQMEIPAGARVTELLEALAQPGADIVGNHYLSVKIGTDGASYDPSWNITVEGGGDQTLYAVSEGSATAVSGENVNGDKVFSLSKGGEILLTRLKEASKNAALQSISVNGKEIGAFKPDKYSYILKYDKSAGMLTVSAVAADPGANVSIVQAESIPGKAVITVTAQDKSVEPLIYTVSLQYNSDEEPQPTVLPTAGSVSGPSGWTPGGPSNRTDDDTATPVVTTRFTDMIGHWAENDVNEMAKQGIVSGVTETTFEPDRSITRAEFAALITRALKLSAANDDSAFADVASDAWYAGEVAAAAAAGLINGYQGYFRPEDTITREEMAVVMMKTYVFRGKEPLNGKLDQFADRESISEWAKAYVDQAVSVGLISGMSTNTFAPRDNATRAQAASIIKRLLDQ